MKLLLTFLVGMNLIGAIDAIAADKWNVGFNHLAVAGNMQRNGRCGTDKCPHNSDVVSPTESGARIYDLSANRHVGAFREIIPLAALAPTAPSTPGGSSTDRNYQDAIDVITSYSGYSDNLVIAFGLPLPSWMVGGRLGTYSNVMPASDADWELLKNKIAMEIGYFVKALWESPRINRTWMSTHLYIEGFNEFDSLENLESLGGGNPIRGRATPVRAASLQNGVQWALNYFKLPVQTLMPSIVGAFPNMDIPTYLSAYYAAYGTGLPNVHIYVDNATLAEANAANDFTAQFVQQVNRISAALPLPLQNQIYVTETGAAERDANYCQKSNPNSMTPTQRAQLYAKIASNATTLAKVKSLLFWRLVKGPSSEELGCETYFGVDVALSPSAGVSYNATGVNLFNYLNH